MAAAAETWPLALLIPSLFSMRHSLFEFEDFEWFPGFIRDGGLITCDTY